MVSLPPQPTLFLFFVMCADLSGVRWHLIVYFKFLNRIDRNERINSYLWESDFDDESPSYMFVEHMSNAAN